MVDAPPRITPAVTGVAVRSARIGLGLFATRRFAQGRTIGRIGGRVYHWRVLLRRGGSFLANCFRFGDDTYLDPLNGLGRYLNHSCRPNAGIRKRNNKLYLFAARAIKPGGQLVIDYSTIIGDDDTWRMRCHCGSRGCRQWVGRFGLLPKRVREDYINRALLPDFMYETLEEPPTERATSTRRPRARTS